MEGGGRGGRPGCQLMSGDFLSVWEGEVSPAEWTGWGDGGAVRVGGC